MEDLEVFQRFVNISDWAWEVVNKWPPLARDTVGKQLIRACDSIGANLVEGDGRYRDADALHFLIIARASARETRYWLNRAVVRRLVEAEVGEAKIAELFAASRMLNALISYRRTRDRGDRVRELTGQYDATDPNSLTVFLDVEEPLTHPEERTLLDHNATPPNRLSPNPNT